MDFPATAHGGPVTFFPKLLSSPKVSGAVQAKSDLRAALRAERRAHVAALPASTRALILSRPPLPVAAMVPPDAVVGLYHAGPDEAPTGGYARYFAEAGHTVALPWFAARDAAMTFRAWDPFAENGLEPGPWRALQPPADAAEVTPAVVFVPLLGFTDEGARLGQGAGHYDRWLAAHPVTAIGLAWDVQLRDELPHEPHDRALTAVVTPTRIYGSGR